jgi:hypothetical protein
MSRTLSEWDADQAAIEAEHRAACLKAADVVARPQDAAMSELLAMFVGLSVGGALGMPPQIPGTEIDRDAALGVVGTEIDRRLPK